MSGELAFITGDRGEARLTPQQMAADPDLYWKLQALDQIARDQYPHLLFETRKELPTGEVIIRWEPACDACADRDLGALLLQDNKLTLCQAHMDALAEEAGAHE